MLRSIAHFLLKLAGWTLIGAKPSEEKAVIIGAPHTSNWDGVLLIVAGNALGTRLRWLVKDSLYKFPTSVILALSGAIPIDRSKSRNTVDQAIDLLTEGKGDLYLTLSPEGTRKLTPHWKSGFYYIALGAKVPIYFGFVDYKRKQTGIGGKLVPSGNVEADMQIIREFYQTKTAKFPEKYGEIKLAPRQAERLSKTETVAE
jgi:1-acyl-sn-glycerol-3-phosphate acyltransferase